MYDTLGARGLTVFVPYVFYNTVTKLSSLFICFPHKRYNISELIMYYYHHCSIFYEKHFVLFIYCSYYFHSFLFQPFVLNYWNYPLYLAGFVYASMIENFMLAYHIRES